MEKQLELVAASYDRGVDLGRKGINLYKNLPEHITSDPDYRLFEEAMQSGSLSDSARKEIKGFLAPDSGMSFVDLGCSLNFMFSGYDEWPSLYYGVDISAKTIELLDEFAAKKGLAAGGFYQTSMHETPFESGFFDIGACIGSLEYFEREFVKGALREFSRIMKPCGRFVLDIPNVGSPVFRITSLIEAHLGREDRYNLAIDDFEALLARHFTAVKREAVGGMLQYFLIANGSRLVI